MTATNSAATAQFHQFYAVDFSENCNRAMTMYRAMERGEFKPVRVVENKETGARYTSTEKLGPNERVVDTYTFDEQVNYYFVGAIFAIACEADDRFSQHGYTNAFDDVTRAMCEVNWGLNDFGFKWYHCETAEEAREAMDMRDAMVIEVTEWGVPVFHY